MHPLVDRTPAGEGRAVALARLVLMASRPALWVNTVGVGVVGLWLAGVLWSFDPRWLAVLVWLTLPYNLLIYGVNDITDQAEDALSDRKGGWQGARVSPGQVRPLLGVILALNAPFLLYFLLALPLPATLVLLGSALLFVMYSLPPVRFKSRPLLDSLSNVAYALPLVVPALLLEVSPRLDVLWGLMAWSVGKHAFDAAQDVSADRAAGVRTVATRLGVCGTALWCLAWFVGAAALLWPISALTAASVALVSGGLALRLAMDATERRARALYPASLLSPWVLGTVSGVQLVYALARGLYP